MTQRASESLLEDLQLHQAELAAQNAELLKLTEALRKSQARYRVLFECGPLPTLALRWSGEIVEYNAAARALVVMPRAEFRNVQQLVLPGFSPVIRTLISEADARGRAEAELGVRTSVGARLVLANLVHVVDPGSQADERTFILTMQDLTSLRSAEAQRDQERAERLRSVGLLAGAIAHDFGNSLQAIRTNLEIAMEAEGKDSLRLAMQSLDSAAGMCRQLLDYIGQKRERDVHCDMVQVGLDTARLCDPEGGRLKQRPMASTSQRAVRVATGATAVHQIVVNLLRNAEEASGGFQGVTLRLSRGIARGADSASALGKGALAPGTPCALIVVSDHGCGMDSVQQRRSTDPFFTTKSHGHGLGLSTVFGLVRGSGGNLRLWSRPGRGTIVRVELPLYERPEPSIAPARSLAKEERSLSLLIVDDEKPVRESMARMLRLQGHQVQTCCDGIEALAALLQPDARFDAAIVDITMPGMSGIQVVKRVKEVSPTFPMVLCSGFAAGVALGTEQLPDDVPLLQKPVSTSELIRTLTQGPS